MENDFSFFMYFCSFFIKISSRSYERIKKYFIRKINILTSQIFGRMTLTVVFQNTINWDKCHDSQKNKGVDHVNILS